MNCIKNSAVLIIIFLLTGCFSKIGSVSGRFTQNGDFVDLKKSAVLQIIFYPSEKNIKISYPADFDRDTFEYKINNIPNGSYKVGIALLDPYPNYDKFQNMFSVETTTINCDIKGQTHFDINIVQ